MLRSAVADLAAAVEDAAVGRWGDKEEAQDADRPEGSWACFWAGASPTATDPEPYACLMNQGQVVNHGKAMSKSLGNGVDLAAELDRHGVDAVRLAMLFSGPPEDDIDWADVSRTRCGSSWPGCCAWSIDQRWARRVVGPPHLVNVVLA